MNNKPTAGIYGFVLGILTLAFFLILMEATPKAERARWEKEAIKRGCGEYIVDVETKDVKFVWKKH